MDHLDGVPPPKAASHGNQPSHGVHDAEKAQHLQHEDKDPYEPQLGVGGHDGTQRRLRNYQVTMIGITSGIGTGLFIGTGAAYAKAGPAGLLLAFIIVGGVLWCVMQSIAELATLVSCPVYTMLCMYSAKRTWLADQTTTSYRSLRQVPSLTGLPGSSTPLSASRSLSLTVTATPSPSPLNVPPPPSSSRTGPTSRPPWSSASRSRSSSPST